MIFIKIINFLLSKFGVLIGIVMNPIIFFFIFFLVITPYGFFYRLFIKTQDGEWLYNPEKFGSLEDEF
jgi:hypothetical protein